MRRTPRRPRWAQRSAESRRPARVKADSALSARYQQLPATAFLARIPACPLVTSFMFGGFIRAAVSSKRRHVAPSGNVLLRAASEPEVSAEARTGATHGGGAEVGRFMRAVIQPWTVTVCTVRS